MRLDIFKILTAVSALIVLRPAAKLPLPLGLLIFSELQSGIMGVGLFLLFYGSFAYLVISVIKRYSDKKDAIFTLGAVIFYLAFYSFFVKDLITFGGILEYATFVIFGIFSLITISLTWNKIRVSQ